jgi:hypothetical protein
VSGPFTAASRTGPTKPSPIGAIGARAAPAYVAMSYPSRAAFTRESGFAPDSPARDERWDERWMDVLRGCAMGIVAAYAPTELVSTIFAEAPAHGPLALATMLHCTGTRAPAVSCRYRPSW